MGCIFCDGKGSLEGKCLVCKGSGQNIRRGRAWVCSVCDGTGKNLIRCDKCNGTGQLPSILHGPSQHETPAVLDQREDGQFRSTLRDLPGPRWEKCPLCLGTTGIPPGIPCPKCGAKGKILIFGR
jgi:DnaJ-class molecular chaperone